MAANKYPSESESWKSHAFMLFLVVFPPSLLTAYCYASPERWQHPPLSGISVLILCEAWLLARVVIPFIKSPLRHLPQPSSGYFLLGHGFPEISSPPGKNLLKLALEIPNEGLIHWRGLAYFRPKLLVTTAEALAEVLSAHAYDYEKPPAGRRFLRRILGDGLVVVEGKMHKIQRKGVTPAFQGKHIKSLVPLFWDKSRKMVEVISSTLAKDVNGKLNGTIEMNHMASRATLDIIGVAAMGRELNALSDSTDPLVASYETILHPGRGRAAGLYFLINMFVPPFIVNLIPWKFNKMVLAAARDLRVICRQLVAEKKRSLASKGSEEKNNVDILSVMLRDENFDDDILVNQLLTFLAAGHETTSNALTWSTMLLSQNQHVQDRLREEVRSKIGSLSSADVDASVIESMPYLHAVCNETLRFYPTVPATVRRAVRPTQILNLGVPVGTEVILSPWVINRLPSLWGPDAGEFNPDRWLEQPAAPAPAPASGNGSAAAAHTDVEKGRAAAAEFAAGSNQNRANLGGAASPYALMTFIHGPRSCIGQGFARTEMKCLLAALVLKFHIELADPNQTITPAGGVTIKPLEGMHLRLREL